MADLLQHAHGGEFRILGHERVDLRVVGIEHTVLGACAVCLRRRLRQGQRLADRLVTAVQAAGDGPLRQFFDLRQTADLGPECHVHDRLPVAVDASLSAVPRISSRMAAAYPRSTPGVGRDKTCVSGAW